MRHVFYVAVVLIGACNLVLAADTASKLSAPAETDPTGTWTWSVPNFNAGPTLILKLEGDKLSGTLKLLTDHLWPLEDAEFKDGTVTFKRRFVTDFGGKRVSTYTGTVTESIIKGTVENSLNGKHVVTQKWEAKRVINSEQP